MKQTSSGHWSVEIEAQTLTKKEKERQEAIAVLVAEECSENSKEKQTYLKEKMCLVAHNQILDEKALQKLHHFNGHCPADKIEKLVTKAGKMNVQVKHRLDKIREDCQACGIYRNRKPKPTTSLPKATHHNQIVTIDLKEWGEGLRKYIAYAVDRHSKLTVGEFLADKKAATIGAFLLCKWISIFGKMQILHSARGGEFLNKELTALAEYMGIKQTSTAASSPNQNGCNERNHATVDRILEKMLYADPTMSPEVALCWALHAKNTLDNNKGFSPAQLVFGANPTLPTIQASGPPGWEEVQMDEIMAVHLIGLHLGREVVIQAESDAVLKEILKRRVYSTYEEVECGNWIYYKNEK